MSEQPLTRQTPTPERHDGIAPPPRLLWLAVGLFVFFIAVGAAAFIIYQTQQRLIALFPLVLVVVAVLVIGSIIGAVMFRKSLPRFFLPVLLGGLVLLVIAGIIGSVVIFTSVLRPEYQQIVVTQVPFMQRFLPPTPQGGVLPTALPGGDGDISPQDLLGAPLLGSTPTPEATEEPTLQPTEVTEAAMIQVEPSATPTLPATATLQPTATTVPPTSAPTEEVQDEAAVAVSVPNRPVSKILAGITHVKQGWNNCGPANITMALSYYGWREDQSVAANFLKPDREDKNVNPGEMVAFVNEQTGVRAITRIGGDLDLIKDFLVAGFPVIIETGYMPEGYDWIGHYQTVVGYDDFEDMIYLYDSYLGSGENGNGMKESYASVDENWKHFNRTFIVIYEQSREGDVSAILGDRADPIQAAEHALSVGQEEARANRTDVYAWFNIGTAFTKMGHYEEAAAAYDQALRLGTLPWRITWYQFGPFEAYFNVQRYDDVLALVDGNLTNGAQYVEETYYWQGRVYEARGDNQSALGSFNRALQHNPRFEAARQARDSLNA